jgi:hypothetical protein
MDEGQLARWILVTAGVVCLSTVAMLSWVILRMSNYIAVLVRAAHIKSLAEEEGTERSNLMAIRELAASWRTKPPEPPPVPKPPLKEGLTMTHGF